jgi:hypothetical protein
MWFDLIKNDYESEPDLIGTILSSLMGRRATLGERSVAYVESRKYLMGSANDR